MLIIKSIVLLIIIIFVCSVLVSDAVLIFGPLLFDVDYFSESKVLNFFVIFFLTAKIMASMYLIIFLSPNFYSLKDRFFWKVIIFPVMFLCLVFILLSYMTSSLEGLDRNFIEAMQVGSFKLICSMFFCFLYHVFFRGLTDNFKS